MIAGSKTTPLRLVRLSLGNNLQLGFVECCISTDWSANLVRSVPTMSSIPIISFQLLNHPLLFTLEFRITLQNYLGYVQLRVNVAKNGSLKSQRATGTCESAQLKSKHEKLPCSVLTCCRRGNRFLESCVKPRISLWYDFCEANVQIKV